MTSVVQLLIFYLLVPSSVFCEHRNGIQRVRRIKVLNQNDKNHLLHSKRKQGVQQETTNHGRSTPWDSVNDFTNSLARQFSMEECGEMAICTAHANYRDYGLMALPLILIFPGSRTKDGEPTSKWQEAALRGKAREECYSRYNCLINPMWILNFVMKTFVY